MSSTAAKIIAGVAVALTILLAVLGYRVSRQYAETSERAEQQLQAQVEVPKLLAVVAVKPLSAYRKIEKDDVRLAEVTVEPKDYYSSLEDVVGKEPLVDVDQGAPVTKRYFGEGNVLARSVPPGFQAISVEVSDVIGVGGFVRPGDIVDVLVYLRGSGDVGTTQARVLLEDTRVLAYHELIVDRPEGLKDDEKSERNSRRQRTAVLAVADADTTRLVLGANLGELRLALHGVIPKDADGLALAPGALGVGGLPLSAEALKAEQDKKVPDKAYTAQQLSLVELPPEKKKATTVVRQKVLIYRSSELETVTP